MGSVLGADEQAIGKHSTNWAWPGASYLLTVCLAVTRNGHGWQCGGTQDGWLFLFVIKVEVMVAAILPALAWVSLAGPRCGLSGSKHIVRNRRSDWERLTLFCRLWAG